MPPPKIKALASVDLAEETRRMEAKLAKIKAMTSSASAACVACGP
jgi:hypothetical protein